MIPWKAEYYRTYLCRTCQLHTVDYSEPLSRHDAELMSRRWAGRVPEVPVSR